MEKQTKTTRFCLICNYVSRIIEPLTSRCTKFRFKPLPDEVQLEKLGQICASEQVLCSQEAMKAIILHTEGDLRKAITYLQSAQKLQSDDGISLEEIKEIAGVIPESSITTLLSTSSSGSFEKLQQAVKEVLLEGFPAAQILNQVFDKAIQDQELTDKQKSKIMEKMAVIDKRLCDGADEHLQIMDLFTVIMDQVTRQP
ncbi:putative replication factor C subunit 4 [Apostichopus japonicus]|uniref:Putative replication factor C subunit 4 n=2 Tax=Stichopus japonicus TaxID=307972 RepID=A0A2G8JYV9_STIJA|nr:putative replication factor C subunit 4 [Apostichopus japonicus]